MPPNSLRSRRALLEELAPDGALQAALAYVLFVASVAALIAKFGSMARSWS